MKRKVGASNELLRAWEAGCIEFNARRFWEAHEQWERGWKDLPRPERDWVQGWIQLAGALHLARIGRIEPARALCRRALELLVGTGRALEDGEYKAAAMSPDGTSAAMAVKPSRGVSARLGAMSGGRTESTSNRSMVAGAMSPALQEREHNPWGGFPRLEVDGGIVFLRKADFSESALAVLRARVRPSREGKSD